MRFWAAAILTLTLSGCVLTPIRRSAFVPRTTVPANHGAPIGKSGVKLYGQVNSAEVPFGGGINTIDELLGQIPSEGAAGVFIPKIQIGGGIHGAPNEYVEIGAQLLYTQLDWAEPNLIGVLDFPPQHRRQKIFLGGPNVRVNIPIKDAPVTPAIILETNVGTIPQAVFVRNGETTVDENGLNVPEYEFKRLDRKTFILPTLAVHLSVRAMDVVQVLGLVGVQRNVKNVGFDPDIENLENDTLTGYAHGIAGIGAEVRYDKFFMTLMAHTAFGQPPEIRFGFSASTSIGVVIN